MNTSELVLHCLMCDGKPFATIEAEPGVTTEQLRARVNAAIDFHIDYHTTRLMVEIEEVLSGQEPH